MLLSCLLRTKLTLLTKGLNGGRRSQGQRSWFMFIETSAEAGFDVKVCFYTL
ncbi:unnamed protein product [Musa acuminata subsp. malaccensis]|uniref:(wild Malaysian banana) hypothetical protein n=1 Tax=Musa acuminata subsp. malaccensis TaxID=214687 RepID=A0A804L2J9_MUSAM|nr:unnamed protein product [Musa acuminata subsp. malaccensis]